MKKAHLPAHAKATQSSPTVRIRSKTCRDIARTRPSRAEKKKEAAK